MPNWTTVVITMDGIDKETSLFTKTTDGELKFDFNSLIPEPKTYKEYMAGVGKFLSSAEDAHLQIDEDRPWFNWYDWHCQCWGTKWNACETSVSEDTVEFWTAWSFPAPVIEALSKKYPDRDITVEFEYEGDNKRYIKEWKNGEVVSEDFEFLNDFLCEEQE